MYRSIMTKSVIMIIVVISYVSMGAYVKRNEVYARDEIVSLPGYDADKLLSRQFSGYLNVSNGMSHLHYWFVESELSPAEAPVVLWLNGGPGCSSLDGFFYELGPFVISTDGSLTLREHRWNRIANMLFIEAPVGVGFSYHDSFDYSNSDDRTAQENREAVEEFFRLFPKYLNNEFFITGESYAGIYVPTLAEDILKGEDDGTYTGASLKGIAVGNGCTGSEIGICGWYFGGSCQGLYYSYTYLLDHAFVDITLKNQIALACDWDSCAAELTPSNDDVLSNECLDLLDKASFQLGEVNIYNVFGECSFNSCKGPENNPVIGRLGPLQPIQTSFGNSPAKLKMQQLANNFKTLGHHSNLGEYKSRSQLQTPLEMLYDDDYYSRVYDDDTSHALKGRGPAGCIDSAAATAYLMRDDVQKAIHVRAPGYCWAVCNQAPGFAYTSTRKNLPRDTYPYLISRLKVLIYNGDWDACVPYTDNQGWTENMGLPTLKPWHAWSYTAESNSTQIGGYTIKYNVSSISPGKGSFEFRTIRGAGHMVPTDAPQQGLTMFSYFIGRNDWSSFVSASSSDSQDSGCVPTEDVSNMKRPKDHIFRYVVIAVCTTTFMVVLGTLIYLNLEIKRLQARLVSRGLSENDRGTAIEMSEHSGRTVVSVVSNPMPYSSVRVQEDAATI